jgi:hypothetical protein
MFLVKGKSLLDVLRCRGETGPYPSSSNEESRAGWSRCGSGRWTCFIVSILLKKKTLDYQRSHSYNCSLGKAQPKEKEEDEAMALPIQPTPILRGKAGRRFEKKIKKDLKSPTTLVDTPRLEEARKLVQKHGEKRQE